MDNLPPLLALPAQQSLRLQLLAWFADTKRDLPWRRTGDLYGIWISEIMLQQTTVAAVVPFWTNFMAKFPHVQALAEAEEGQVLSAWSGLGYYTRARNLHRAAKIICQDMAGDLPATRDQWQALPGVGPYAAGAIASIGLGECVPAMDANARRVIQRWAVTDPVALAALTTTKRQRLVDVFGATLVPGDTPAAWNEAVMELGALICRAKEAQCDECPLTSNCAAHRQDWVDEVPPTIKSPAQQPVWLGVIVVTWRDLIFLQPPLTPILNLDLAGRRIARDDFAGLHQQMWSLPGTAWFVDQTVPMVPSGAWLQDLNLPKMLLKKKSPVHLLGDFSHGITKYRLKVSVYEFSLEGKKELPKSWRATPSNLQNIRAVGGLFFDREQIDPPISQLTRKALELQLNAFD